MLAWHGSRHPDAYAVIARVADRVRGLLPGVDVRIGWVDDEAVRDRRDSELLLPDALAAAGDCTLVPCFLAAGYHVTHDVPQAAASAPHRVRVTPHLGGAFRRALAERVDQAGGPGDLVVLAVAGSSHVRSQAEVEAQARDLSAALGVGVRVGTAYAGGTPVDDVVATARAEGHDDVLVLPYVLAPGLWHARVGRRGVRLAQPLGDHPDVAATIAGRHRATASSLAATTLGR